MNTKTTIRPSTRNALVNAAIGVLAQNPGASLSEIALRAGVARATLHRQYRKKDDLILAMQKLSIYETDKAVIDLLKEGMTALEQLEAMFQGVIPLGDRYHFLFRELSYDPQLKTKYQRELDWLSNLVTALKNEGVVAEKIPDSWTVALLDQLVWTAWREVEAGNIAATDAPPLALRTFKQGLQS